MNGLFAVSATIQSVLRWANHVLTDNGVVNARLNSEIILGHLLKCRRIELYKNNHLLLKPQVLKAFQRLVRKNSNAHPLAYLTRTIEFMSLEFKVRPGVLIPRPETEFVVEESLRLIKTYNNPTVIVEIGTGCGNIVIALAKSAGAKNLRFWASDISRKALKVAQENAVDHKVKQKIVFCYGSLFAAFESLGIKGKIDLLISNPPYVAQRDFAGLPVVVKNHEPRRALLAGKTGLEFHKRIIEGAINYLKPPGYLVLEMGYDQSGGVEEILASTGSFDSIFLVKDLRGINRVISARRKTEK